MYLHSFRNSTQSDVLLNQYRSQYKLESIHKSHKQNIRDSHNWESRNTFYNLDINKGLSVPSSVYFTNYLYHMAQNHDNSNQCYPDLTKLLNSSIYKFNYNTLKRPVKSAIARAYQTINNHSPEEGNIHSTAKMKSTNSLLSSFHGLTKTVPKKLYDSPHYVSSSNAFYGIKGLPKKIHNMKKGHMKVASVPNLKTIELKPKSKIGHPSKLLILKIKIIKLL